MINRQNSTKKTKRTKRVPDFTVYFHTYHKVIGPLRDRLNKIPKRVFYRWSKKRFDNFKETHDRRKVRNTKIVEKRFSIKRDGFFITCMKFYNIIVFYIIFPCSLLFLHFLSFWFVSKYRINTKKYLVKWNRKFPDYAIPYIKVILFLYYYLSSIGFFLKFFLFCPIMVANFFIIWCIHVNTNWIDFMERKLVSLIIWRLGLGLLPALPQLINVYIFWGDRHFLTLYKHIFIDGLFFTIKELWRTFKQVKRAIFSLLNIFFFNIFK